MLPDPSPTKSLGHTSDRDPKTRTLQLPPEALPAVTDWAGVLWHGVAVFPGTFMVPGEPLSPGEAAWSHLDSASKHFFHLAVRKLCGKLWSF